MLSGELKFAVLTKSIGGQLETYLNMTIQDSTTYEALRESILQYDQATIKWSNTMALGTSMQSNDEATPMEVGRIWKGKGKGKDKGKNDKRKGKGWKGKGKSEKDGKNHLGSWNNNSNGGWNQGKGQSWNQSNNQGQSSNSDKSGKSFSKGKDKSGKNKNACWKCGKIGHMAKECRVRFVEETDGARCNNNGASGSTANGASTNATKNTASSSNVNRVSVQEHPSSSSSIPQHFFDLSDGSDFSRLSVNVISEVFEMCNDDVSFHDRIDLCEPGGNDIAGSLRGSMDSGDSRLPMSSYDDECFQDSTIASIDECICSSTNSIEFIYSVFFYVECRAVVNMSCVHCASCMITRISAVSFRWVVASRFMSGYYHNEVPGA